METGNNLITQETKPRIKKGLTKLLLMKPHTMPL